MNGCENERDSGHRIEQSSGDGLYRRWQSDRPDLVHVESSGRTGKAAVRAARRVGSPVCSTFDQDVHGIGRDDRRGLLEQLRVRSLRSFHNRTDFTIVPSHWLRTRLGGLGFRNDFELS